MRVSACTMVLALAVAVLAGCAGPDAPAATRHHASPAQDAVGNPVSVDPKLNRQFQ